MASDTLYSLSTTISGGASASFSDGSSPPLPPSGTLRPDIYELCASASALAQAQDVNGVEIVTAGPREASAWITFAPVGSPTLIRGTVLAGGAGMAGLLVEARDGGIVIASALTTPISSRSSSPTASNDPQRPPPPIEF